MPGEVWRLLDLNAHHGGQKAHQSRRMVQGAVQKPQMAWGAWSRGCGGSAGHRCRG